MYDHLELETTRIEQARNFLLTINNVYVIMVAYIK